MDKFEEQGDALRGALTDIYSAAVDAFNQQQEDIDAAQADLARALADREAEITSSLRRIYDAAAAPVRAGNSLLEFFGADVPASEDAIVEHLMFQIECMNKWADTLDKLSQLNIADTLFEQIANAGPIEGMNLANALLGMDTDQLNGLMSELEAVAGRVGTIAEGRLGAGIRASVEAADPLPEIPAHRELNELLQGEIDKWNQAEEARKSALAWAEMMTANGMVPLNMQWRTFDDLLAEELESMAEAEAKRNEVRRWAEGMALEIMPAYNEVLEYNIAHQETLQTIWDRQLATLPSLTQALLEASAAQGSFNASQSDVSDVNSMGKSSKSGGTTFEFNFAAGAFTFTGTPEESIEEAIKEAFDELAEELATRFTD
jgi:hypothetical protein